MVIDVHSHVLPNIDDGSGSVEESIAMLRQTSAQGISRVVATPHFYAGHDHHPEHFLLRRADAYKRLSAAMERQTGLPEILLGAEVHYFGDMSEAEELQKLRFLDTEFILVEMPMAHWTDRMYRELAAIKRNLGLTPIVAHVDRYIGPLRNREIPERLEELPVLVQANAGFFLRRSTRRMALRMLQKGQIHLLGSDCHNMGSRPPCLGEAVSIIQRSLGKEALQPIRETQNRIFGNSDH